MACRYHHARSGRRTKRGTTLSKPDSEQGAYEGPLAEFSALRQEIERRNLVQHGLFVLQLTSAGAIFSFVLAHKDHLGFLLIIPISTYMLCARYVEQQYGIQRAAIYIKTELSNRVPGGLGWEAWQTQHLEFVRGSTIRRVNALLIIFPAIASAALIWTVAPVFGAGFRLSTVERLGIYATWFAGIIAIVFCVQMIWSMMRHPLGDSTLPALYKLPAEVDHIAAQRGSTDSAIRKRQRWLRNHLNPPRRGFFRIGPRP
jgi:putative Mn2+ efflux pump MntP